MEQSRCHRTRRGRAWLHRIWHRRLDKSAIQLADLLGIRSGCSRLPPYELFPAGDVFSIHASAPPQRTPRDCRRHRRGGAGTRMSDLGKNARGAPCVAAATLGVRAAKSGARRNPQRHPRPARRLRAGAAKRTASPRTIFCAPPERSTKPTMNPSAPNCSARSCCRLCRAAEQEFGVALSRINLEDMARDAEALSTSLFGRAAAARA